MLILIPYEFYYGIVGFYVFFYKSCILNKIILNAVCNGNVRIKPRNCLHLMFIN